MTQPGASFNVVLPRQSSYFPIQPSLSKVGATRVVLLGPSSSHGGEFATVLFNLKVDPHTNHVLTVTNALDPRFDATGNLSLDALVVAMRQVTRFVGSNTLPWDLSSLFMNVDSLLEELSRINGIFLDPSSSNSAPLEVPATPTLPYSWLFSSSTTPSTSANLTTCSPSVPLSSVNQSSDGLLTGPGTPTITPNPLSPSPIDTDTGGCSLGSGTASVVSSPSDVQSFGTTVSTPVTPSSSQPSFSSTSRPSTSPVQHSSGSPSDTSSLSGASPYFSPSLLNTSTRAVSKSAVAVITLTSLFGVFSLTLGGIALWMTRARRSKVAATSHGEEQANIATTAREDWLHGGRPLSDGSPYSDLHSPRPSEAKVRRPHRSVAASARFEVPPSMREPERGRIDASPPLSALSLGSPSSSPWAREHEINNVIRRAGMSG
ncbi:hypothetical protein BC827DRAFT_1263218 [Russula dissimulans]|nr:hypothetical protein BC827DRAFT_1263218 [Russula dissimulans]